MFIYMMYVIITFACLHLKFVIPRSKLDKRNKIV